MKRATETAAAQLAQIERDLSVNMATQIRESVRVRARARRAVTRLGGVLAVAVPATERACDGTCPRRSSHHPLPPAAQLSFVNLAHHLAASGDLAGSMRTWCVPRASATAYRRVPVCECCACAPLCCVRHIAAVSLSRPAIRAPAFLRHRRRTRVREYCANAKQTADATMHVMEAALLLGQAQTVVVNADRGEVLAEAAANPLCVLEALAAGRCRRARKPSATRVPRRACPIPRPPRPARASVAVTPRS